MDVISHSTESNGMAHVLFAVLPAAVLFHIGKINPLYAESLWENIYIYIITQHWNYTAT